MISKCCSVDAQICVRVPLLAALIVGSARTCQFAQPFFFLCNRSERIIRRNSKQFSTFYISWHCILSVSSLFSRTRTSSPILKSAKRFISWQTQDTHTHHTFDYHYMICDKEHTEAIERNRATTIARFATEQKSRSFPPLPSHSFWLFYFCSASNMATQRNARINSDSSRISRCIIILNFKLVSVRKLGFNVVYVVSVFTTSTSVFNVHCENFETRKTNLI